MYQNTAETERSRLATTDEKSAPPIYWVAAAEAIKAGGGGRKR
jgi:hypothetical protein